MKKIRLLIVEDNRLLREGIVAVTAEQPDIKIVAALGARENILQMIRTVKPNVMLLDLGLRSQNSLHIVKSVRKDFPETKVIIMDLVPMQSDVFEFVGAGVSGFLLKDATIDDFLGTIRSVARGTKVLPPHLTGSLFSQIVENAVNSRGTSGLMESARLTKRERQVIELIADGLSNKEIAQKIHLSPYTVKSHVHNILEKLALHTRVQIAKFAHTSENITTASDAISLIGE